MEHNTKSVPHHTITNKLFKFKVTQVCPGILFRVLTPIGVAHERN